MCIAISIQEYYKKAGKEPYYFRQNGNRIIISRCTDTNPQVLNFKYLINSFRNTSSLIITFPLKKNLKYSNTTALVAENRPRWEMKYIIMMPIQACFSIMFVFTETSKWILHVHVDYMYETYIFVFVLDFLLNCSVQHFGL